MHETACIPGRREEVEQDVLRRHHSSLFVYAISTRATCFKLPVEDARADESDLYGRLFMSMYGTRDVALNWADEYVAGY